MDTTDVNTAKRGTTWQAAMKKTRTKKQYWLL